MPLARLSTYLGLSLDCCCSLWNRAAGSWCFSMHLLILTSSHAELLADNCFDLPNLFSSARKYDGRTRFEESLCSFIFSPLHMSSLLQISISPRIYTQMCRSHLHTVKLKFETLIETVETPLQRKTYLAAQKSPPKNLPFMERMQGIQDLA